jgi:hypothetical protein
MGIETAWGPGGVRSVSICYWAVHDADPPRYPAKLFIFSDLVEISPLRIRHTHRFQLTMPLPNTRGLRWKHLFWQDLWTPMLRREESWIEPG